MKTKVRSCQVKQKQRLRGCSGKNAKRRGERNVEKWRHRIAESAKAAKKKQNVHMYVSGGENKMTRRNAKAKENT